MGQLIFVFIFGLVSLSSAAFPANAQDINGIAKVRHARSYYTRALAEAQLNYAQARLTDALTAGEWQEARRLTLSVDRYELELKRLRRDERNLHREIERATNTSRTANSILSGNTEPRALNALQFMQKRYIPAAVTRAAMGLPVGALGPGEFFLYSSNGAPTPFEGNNVGQLLAHLQKYKLQLEPWGEGHMALVDALVLISEATEAELIQLEERLAQLKFEGDSTI